MAIKIDRIDAGSEAEALGLQPGDELLSVVKAAAERYAGL